METMGMDWESIIAFGAAVCGAFMSIAFAWSMQRNFALGCLSGALILMGFESAFMGFVVNSVDPGEALFWQKATLLAGISHPGLCLLFTALFLRDENSFQHRKRKWLLPFVVLLPVGMLGALLMHAIPFLPSPGSAGYARATSLLWHPWSFVASVFGMVNLERTFRASVGVMRWRIKFILLALGLILLTRSYTSSQALLFSFTSVHLEMVNSVGLIIGCILMAGGWMRFESGQRIAVYPSQSALRHSITFVLAGVYLVAVGVLAKAIDHFGGRQSFELKAFLVLAALVCLGVALVSDKLRLRLRNFVSRHFNRPLYDYRNVWRSFTESTAQCLDTNSLCRSLARLTSELFQALSVHVWIVDDSGSAMKLVSSTVAQGSPGGAANGNSTVDLHSPESGFSGMLDSFLTDPSPLDLDRSKAPWASKLSALHPQAFHAGGNLVACPIISEAKVLGLIVLADRVAGVKFADQDLDLLKVLAEQAGASLGRLQIAEKLGHAKQLEAFQTMSAFFVHDLKNTASVLSLMLKNLPVHWDDPAFRVDALRGIEKTVAHINDLISRLGTIRSELTVRPIKCDLNHIIKTTLSERPDHQAIHPTLGQLPPVHADPELMATLLSNLIANACEAAGAKGNVRVETQPRNEWVVIEVSDNGRGMSAEFLRDSLFKPFCSTKQRGLGIGMFQCKMIVEAHHGRIQVESTLGKGTCFRVLLPAMMEA